MEQLQEYIIPWIVSNVVILLFLWASIRKPKLARLLFALLFGWACWLNYTTAHQNPDDYLNYANFTPFSWLVEFINGWFKDHITLMVTIISIGQGLIALGMLLKDNMVRLAGIGAMVFFIAIMPLGIGSAFPFSIIAIIAIFFILKKDIN